MELQKEVAKAEIDRVNNILEKRIGKANNICTVVEAVYVMGTTEEEKKMNWNDKRKEQKNQEGPNRKIQKLEKQFKELRKTLA